MGMNATRFIACACCCSTSKKIVRRGMSIVPPPIPNPPSTPDISPAKTSKIIFCISKIKKTKV